MSGNRLASITLTHLIPAIKHAFSTTLRLSS
ncbi:hypothetical protein SBV1_1050022 [Verrucomicrobia bacterium]|nr:hypothetical protein SBV1_1050022 [Verrucomicrobiota bacterium]